jgi:hypothetical protein
MVHKNCGGAHVPPAARQLRVIADQHVPLTQTIAPVFYLELHRLLPPEGNTSTQMHSVDVKSFKGLADFKHKRPRA